MNKNNFSGNAGEWSEVYVFLKLLADEKLIGAKADLSPDPSLSLRVLRVIRQDTSGMVSEPVIFQSADGKKSQYSRQVIEQTATRLYHFIQRKIGTGQGAFVIPEMDEFVKNLGCKTLCCSNKKSDIGVCVVDSHIGGEAEYGFSIKSEMGTSPTLLNAGTTTNVIFEVTGLDATDTAKINAIQTKTKIIDRCDAIKDKATSIKFHAFQNPIFFQNLQTIDDGLPSIVAHSLLARYFAHKTTCPEIVATLAEKNPHEYANISLYEIKFKRFLRTIALGMKPATPWDDLDDATGGYIIVRKDGSLVAFYIYNRKKFDEYLFQTTRLERASTTRYDYMNLYQEKDANGQAHTFLKLNLQIRFI